MKSKINPEDKPAMDVLLYLDRCAQAVRDIPKPDGLNVQFQVIPLDGEAGKATSRAKEISEEASDKLDEALRQADAADAEEDKTSKRSRTRPFAAKVRKAK